MNYKKIAAVCLTAGCLLANMDADAAARSAVKSSAQVRYSVPTKAWPQGGVNIITDADGKTRSVVTREAKHTPAKSSAVKNNTIKNSGQTSPGKAAAAQSAVKADAAKKTVAAENNTPAQKASAAQKNSPAPNNTVNNPARAGKKDVAAEQNAAKNNAVKRAAAAEKNSPVPKASAAQKKSPTKNNGVKQIGKNKKSAGAKNTSLLTHKDGKAYFSGTELPKDYKNISIFGEAVAAKSQAVALIKANNPQVRLACSVEELVDLYWEEAGREHVRPDLALAQSLVETGSYRYGGDVQHKQNNFCGLGTTGKGVKGASFKTPQLGVRAHVQHLLAYTQKKRPSTSIVDPRYDIAHKLRLERGMVDTWYGLNGTWAMGSLYCEKIMAMYQKMLAQPLKETQSAKKKQKSKDKKSKKKKAKEKRIEKAQQQSMRDRMQILLEKK